LSSPTDTEKIASHIIISDGVEAPYTVKSSYARKTASANLQRKGHLHFALIARIIKVQ
jgi:hypothetical protein